MYRYNIYWWRYINTGGDNTDILCTDGDIINTGGDNTDILYTSGDI